MKSLHWSAAAAADIARLHDFLAAVNPAAAARAVQAIVAAPERLQQHPRLGERLDEFLPREVRRILVGSYEMRYELRGDAIFVLRLWHAREER